MKAKILAFKMKPTGISFKIEEKMKNHAERLPTSSGTYVRPKNLNLEPKSISISR